MIDIATSYDRETVVTFERELEQVKRERDWLANKAAYMCKWAIAPSCYVGPDCPEEQKDWPSYGILKDDWLQAAKEAVCQK